MRLLSAILGVVFAATAQVAAAQTVPERFHGVWKFAQGQQGTCKQSDWNSDAHTDEHINVTRGDVDLHETKCRFASVETARPDHESNPVRLTLTCMGEGEKWQSVEIWQLLKLGDKPVLVTARTNRGKEFISIYQQCERTGPRPSSAGDASRAAPVTGLPLKPGFYVASDTPCGQASNATLSLVRRNGMNVSRMSCDFKKIEQTGPARYQVTEECKELTQGTSETDVRTYEVANDSSFKSLLPDGTSYQARYCAQSSLPAPWRNINIGNQIR